MSHLDTRSQPNRGFDMVAAVFLGLLTMSGAVSPVRGTEQRNGGAGPDDQETRIPQEDREQEEAGATEPSVDELIEELGLGKIVPLEDAPMASFYRALDTLVQKKRGKVRILHYGDSHTAADFLPSTIRRELQTRFGDGGRGFVYLGTPWRSFAPMDVETASRGRWKTLRIYSAKDPTELDGWYGLGGIAVESSYGRGWVAMGTSRGSRFGDKASHIEIFYLKQPGGGSFAVSVDNRSQGVVNAGSSRLASGFYELDLEEGPHVMRIQQKGAGKVRLFGAAMETDGPGIVYDALGINGAFFYTALKWDKAILKEQVERRDPQLIVTMYGANEADAKSLTEEKYTKKVRNALEKLRAGAPDAACLMLGPTDRVITRPPVDGKERLDLVIDVQRELAEEAGCAFMDLRDLMGGPGSFRSWQLKGMAQTDGVHLTVTGYRFLGEMIAKQILESYDHRRSEVRKKKKRKSKRRPDERSGGGNTRRRGR